MITKQKIEQAYSAMKSDNDFETLVAELNAIEVTGFTFYVKDGSELFWDEEEENVLIEARFPVIAISSFINEEGLQSAIAAHQNAEDDFATFRQLAADCGVKFWSVDLLECTCTYFDNDGEIIYTETF
jgi:uncharacterized protein YbcV (DUF1398 family)